MNKAELSNAAAVEHSPKWDLYRYFLTVAKTSSISNAAQILRESAPTVSRRIRELEAHFSDVLFRRTPGKLVLTPTGERLRDRLSQIDQEMSALHQDLAGAQTALKGHVTITAPRGFGKAVLLDCLGQLRQEMPDVRYSAIFRTKRLNLRHREADIAIRIGDEGDDGMTRRRIGDVRFGLYASTSYLNQHGVPHVLGDLNTDDCVGLEDGGDLAQIAELMRLAPGLAPGLSVDCILLQAQTVSLGHGFAPLPHYMTKSFPNLIEILPNVLTSQAPVWLLAQPDLAKSACVKATLPRLEKVCAEALV